jgi:antitoxin VapB
MATQRRVRLFRNGRNQAVRIPREFELEAKEVILRREGDRLVLEPVTKRGLLAVLAKLRPIPETVPDVDQGLPPLDDLEL